LNILTTTLLFVHGKHVHSEKVLHCLHADPKELAFFPLISKESMGHALVAKHMVEYGDLLKAIAKALHA
jgi:hypothetical protein